MDEKKKYVRHDYDQLRAEFLVGSWPNVSAFLKSKGIPQGNPTLWKEGKSWMEEKKIMKQMIIEKAKSEIIERDVNDLQKSRERRANLGRWLQLKGTEGLKEVKPKDLSVEDSRKLIATGVDIEEKAVEPKQKEGGGSLSLTQINLKMPKTKLDELLSQLDYEGTLRLIAELRRQRTLRNGEGLVIQGSTATK